MRIIIVVGARPHVVKVGPLLPELARAGFTCDVAFTGSRSARHDDDTGGTVTFYGVEMPAPRWFLDIGSGTHAVEAGRAMVEFEALFSNERPDCVLVIGDVAVSLAAAVSAAQAQIPVVHLDAGLRCGDMAVPEEVNRVLISRVASMHLTPTERALENLEDEGVDPERIHFVGNMLAESVIRHLDTISTMDAAAAFGVSPGGYVLGCFHRPENLGVPRHLEAIFAGLSTLEWPIILPDTNGLRAALASAGIGLPPGVVVTDAVPYQSMLALERDALVVVTDSSGVQEEACTLCTPCVTVRVCTEQVVTVEAGANVLVPAEAPAVAEAIRARASGHPTWAVPQRWDRAVSDRVVRALKRGVMPLA